MRKSVLIEFVGDWQLLVGLENSWQLPVNWTIRFHLFGIIWLQFLAKWPVFDVGGVLEQWPKPTRATFPPIRDFKNRRNLFPLLTDHKKQWHRNSLFY